MEFPEQASANGAKNSAKNASKTPQKKPTAQNDLEFMKENRRLCEKLAEAKKENLFLKKAAAFFAKGIDERHIDS